MFDIEKFTFDHNGKAMRIKPKKELGSLYKEHGFKVHEEKQVERNKDIYPDEKVVVLKPEETSPDHFSDWKFG